MPLGDAAAFYDWLIREDPSYSLLTAVKSWIDGLDSAPWQAPSVPWEHMSVPGEYQVRSAVVDGVEIIYKEDYSTQTTDLIDVRSSKFP